MRQDADVVGARGDQIIVGSALGAALLEFLDVGSQDVAVAGQDGVLALQPGQAGLTFAERGQLLVQHREPRSQGIAIGLGSGTGRIERDPARVRSGADLLGANRIATGNIGLKLGDLGVDVADRLRIGTVARQQVLAFGAALQDLVLCGNVQVLLQHDLSGNRGQLRRDGLNATRGLAQLRLGREAVSEGRLIGGCGGRLGRGEVADVVGGEEPLIGVIDVAEFVLEGLALCIDGLGRVVLENLAAVGLIALENGGEDAGRLVRVVALVAQRDDRTGRAGADNERVGHLANGVAFLLGHRTGRRLARMMKGAEAQSPNGAQFHVPAGQDVGLGLGDLSRRWRAGPLGHRPDARLVDVFLTGAGIDLGRGDIGLLQRHHGCGADAEDHEEDDDHQQQLAEHQADDVRKAVTWTGGHIGRAHGASESIG